jgi:nitroreductase
MTSSTSAGVSNAANSSIPPDSAALQRLLDARYSCRGFLKDPVPDEVIGRILQLSQRTASWCNAQPWQVVITKGAATGRFRQALLEQVSEAQSQPDFPWPREYLGVYLERRRECGFQLYESVGVARGDRVASGKQGLRNFELFDAPHAAIITTDEALGVYGAVDCGAWVSNFMLAARSMGVATIAQAALASHSPFVRAHFGIPDNRRVVCGISFGYEDSKHPANGFRTRRATVADTVTFFDK